MVKKQERIVSVESAVDALIMVAESSNNTISNLMRMVFGISEEMSKLASSMLGLEATVDRMIDRVLDLEKQLERQNES